MKFGAIFRLLPKKFLSKLLCLLLSFSLLTSVFISTLPTDTEAASQDDLATLTASLKTKNEELKNAPALFRAGKVNDIKKTAEFRRDKLKKLMEADPAQVGKYVISDRDDFAQEVRDLIERKTEEKGVFRQVITDYEDGTAENKYFLFEGNDLSVSPKFVVTADKVNIDPTRINNDVTISGFALDSQLWYSAGENTQLATATAVSASASPVGDRKIGYFYVTFTDNRTRSIAEADLDNFINGKFKNFISDSSSGRLNIINAIHPLDLDIAKTCELINIFGIFDKNGALVKAVYEKARSMGINPDEDTDHMIILDTSVSCGSFAGKSMLGPGWALSVGTGSIDHEFGHNMWLAHAQTWDCGYAVILADCVSDEYGNFTDVMGRGALDDNDFGGFAKHSLGWTGPGEIVDLDRSSGGGTFTLGKYENRGDGTPRLLRISTFSGGPVYYIQYRRKGENRFLLGPTVELASSSLGNYKKTRLIDTTPSSQIGLADFNDGYIGDGEEFNDPFNGILVKSVSRDSSSVTLEVSFYQGYSYGSLSVSWNRPDGYVSAAGQKLDVNWSNALYVMSHRCTAGYGCDPDNWVSEPATTAHNGQFLMASSNLGYQYEYKVMILTKDDNNNSLLALYPWVDATQISNDCGGATSCQAAIFWPTTTYRVTLAQKSDGQPACTTRLMPGVTVGCQDAIMIGDNTSLTFKGLPADIPLSGKVHVNDKSGTLHLLQDFADLGTSQTYVKSCTGGIGCSINGPAGIGPFVGYEPLLTAVRKSNANGVIIRGPEFNLAESNGSFSIGGWSWDYYAEVYPNSSSSCAASGGQCQRSWVRDSQTSSFTRDYDGLQPGVDYRVRVCVKDCSSSSGDSFVVNQVIPSSAIGPVFFSSDPFDMANHGFGGKYYDNDNYSGLKLTRFDPLIKFDWKSGSPDPSISPTNFSARWEGDFDFSTDLYRFMIMTDKQVQVYIDGEKVIDRQTVGVQSIVRAMDYGSHHIRVDYTHESGNAFINFAAVKAYSCFDQNGDGRINSTDMLIITKNYGARGVTPWDLNADFKVNSTDQLLVAKKFNTTCQLY